jgi:hypothetical protein
MSMTQELDAGEEGAEMSMMCSVQGCKTKAGMCSHEKMILGLAVLLVVGFVGGKLFGLF